jgi:diguanylate cyclase (GGDEF)-like protein
LFAEEPLQDRDQRLSEDDQTASDADQDGSDLDQTTSESDQLGSDTDQIASDRDQRAADIDQAASDRSAAQSAPGPEYEQTRRTRSQTTLERDVSTQARSDAARIREENANRRDGAAEMRDAIARERDELAAAMDARIDELEKLGPIGRESRHTGIAIVLRAAQDRKHAAESRARAAAQRHHAALDRAKAQEDRRRAAEDRAAAAAELAAEGVDHLTGALRRRVGLAAMQREFDRVARTGEMLVVAFVDVDGLKAVNDTRGHASGDGLLRDVTRCIKIGLRPYDVVTRYGGDELVCSVAGEGISGIRDRFEEASARIADCQHGATISVGLAERDAGDTLPALIARADAAMLARRHDRRRA